MGGRPVPRARRGRPPLAGWIGAAALLALAALLAFPGVLRFSASDAPTRAPAHRGDAQQERAGRAMSRIAGRVATSWFARRSETGLFVDPITGGAGHGYGPAMLAEVLIREGARRRDRPMLRAGLVALSVNATRAMTDGTPGNPLELLGIASAYRWGQRHLGGSAGWERWSPGPRRYLRTWESADVGRAAHRCFVSPTCWNNYKIVDAAAVLLLLDTGLRAATPSARLADPGKARAAVMRVLRRDLPLALGDGASAEGEGIRLTGLGSLADQPTFPLAYHSLSAAALARALEVLGGGAPPEARDAFRRAMLAEASFMAPDGDVTFLGRAQGESWALGATAYAGEHCAATFARSYPRTAGICATLAMRAVDRLQRLHGFNDGVLAIVPRFSGTPLTGEGLEHYARVMTFNGLTGVMLAWASDAAQRARGVCCAPLPLDRDGAFADHDRARLAVIRRGRVWFAVHAVGPEGVTDLRYDFGVAALKYRRAGRWVDVVPARPLDDSLGPLDGGGPVLLSEAGAAFPHGRSFSVDAHSGAVVVHGGYRVVPGVWAVRGVDFTFAATRRGVRITAEAPAGSALRVQDYLPPAWTEALDAGRVLRTPTAVSRVSETPSLVEPGLLLTSANSTQVQGYRRHVVVPPSGRITWTVAARRLPSGPGGG